MAITIKGIKLNSMNLESNPDGGLKIGTAEYNLISSVDKVLAKQTVGGYGGLTLVPSVTTQQALDTFVRSYTEDITALLGLTE